jgi:transposase-like protein
MKNSKIKKENLQWLIKQPVKMQQELFKNFVELAKMHYNQLVEEELKEKAGKKYERGKRYNRWGINPGSIRIGEEKVPIEVPRLYDKEEERTEEAENYRRLHNVEKPTEELMRKIILGLSQKDYEQVTRTVLESFGMSQSSVSRSFIEESSRRLEEFESRDGKYLSKDNIIIALGVTITGVKIPLGFVQATTENTEAVKGLIQDLIKRKFRFKEGILTVVDGSKGLKKAISETFGKYALIQRCQWHKRENVVSYLNKNQEDIFRGKLQRAYQEPDYETAKRRLYEIRDELEKINRSAARSLEEGLEETLQLHKLGLIEELGSSFSTTNLIENLNSQLRKYLGRIRKWVNPDMKARWLATSLTEIEHKMRRVNNFEKLYLLRAAIKSELKLKQQKVA